MPSCGWTTAGGWRAPSQPAFGRASHPPCCKLSLAGNSGLRSSAAALAAAPLPAGLQLLDLSGVQLPGDLSPWAPPRLLQQLSLIRCGLLGQLPAVRALANLTRLSLGNNILSGAPEGWAPPQATTFLDLSSNQLDEGFLSAWRPADSQLRFLYLESNDVAQRLGAGWQLPPQLLFLKLVSLPGASPPLQCAGWSALSGAAAAVLPCNTSRPALVP